MDNSWFNFIVVLCRFVSCLVKCWIFLGCNSNFCCDVCLFVVYVFVFLNNILFVILLVKELSWIVCENCDVGIDFCLLFIMFYIINLMFWICWLFGFRFILVFIIFCLLV